MHFLMGLHKDFKPTRASPLSRSPTPTLDAVVKELIFEENRRPTYHMSSSNHVLATSSFPLTVFHYCNHCPSMINLWASLLLVFKRYSLRGLPCQGHDISICHKLQKFMHEKNKAPPPRVAAMCPLDLSVPIGLSLAFLLTTIDIEAIVQQVLS